MTNLCKNCKHFGPNWYKKNKYQYSWWRRFLGTYSTSTEYKCMHDSADVPLVTEEDKIYGGLIWVAGGYHKYANQMRKSDDEKHCGPEGKFYEPID